MEEDNIANVWATFYAGIVAFQYHPRNDVPNRMSHEECAHQADLMMDEFMARRQMFHDMGAAWRGS